MTGGSVSDASRERRSPRYERASFRVVAEWSSGLCALRARPLPHSSSSHLCRLPPRRVSKSALFAKATSSRVQELLLSPRPRQHADNTGFSPGSQSHFESSCNNGHGMLRTRSFLQFMDHLRSERKLRKAFFSARLHQVVNFVTASLSLLLPCYSGKREAFCLDDSCRSEPADAVGTVPNVTSRAVAHLAEVQTVNACGFSLLRKRRKCLRATPAKTEQHSRLVSREEASQTGNVPRIPYVAVGSGAYIEFEDRQECRVNSLPSERRVISSVIFDF